MVTIFVYKNIFKNVNKRIVNANVNVNKKTLVFISFILIITLFLVKYLRPECNYFFLFFLKLFFFFWFNSWLFCIWKMYLPECCFINIFKYLGFNSFIHLFIYGLFPPLIHSQVHTILHMEKSTRSILLFINSFFKKWHLEKVKILITLGNKWCMRGLGCSKPLL